MSQSTHQSVTLHGRGVDRTILKPAQYDIRFGFDPDIIQSFTDGDCWYLMAELEKRGYPAVKVGTMQQFAIGHHWWCVHGLNLLPDGRLFDITGVYHHPHDVFAQWRYALGHSEKQLITQNGMNDPIYSAFVSPSLLTPRQLGLVNRRGRRYPVAIVHNGERVYTDRKFPRADQRWAADAVEHLLSSHDLV